MTYCLKLYRRSNTTNKNIVEIKNILDKWLVELELTKKSKREATITGFKKAFYTFFVLEIQQNS